MYTLDIHTGEPCIQHLMPTVAPAASWVQPCIGSTGQPHNLTDVLHNHDILVSSLPSSSITNLLN